MHTTRRRRLTLDIWTPARRCESWRTTEASTPSWPSCPTFSMPLASDTLPHVRPRARARVKARGAESRHDREKVEARALQKEKAEEKGSLKEHLLDQPDRHGHFHSQVLRRRLQHRRPHLSRRAPLQEAPNSMDLDSSVFGQMFAVPSPSTRMPAWLWTTTSL